MILLSVGLGVIEMETVFFFFFGESSKSIKLFRESQISRYLNVKRVLQRLKNNNLKGPVNIKNASKVLTKIPHFLKYNQRYSHATPVEL